MGRGKTSDIQKLLRELVIFKQGKMSCQEKTNPNSIRLSSSKLILVIVRICVYQHTNVAEICPAHLHMKYKGSPLYRRHFRMDQVMNDEAK